MKKHFIITIICGILILTTIRTGVASGERAFEELPRCAMLGLAVGSFIGLHHYGLSKNMNPQHILDNSIYGLVSGTLLGGTLDAYEMVSHKDIPGEHVLGITGIGALGGAFMGAFWAVIPWALSEDETVDEDEGNERRTRSDSNFYHGMIGLGIGGVSGAAIGFVIGVATMPSPEESARISARIGIQRETEFMNVTSLTPAPQFCYRLVEINFK
jgi:hypothetical protein